MHRRLSFALLALWLAAPLGAEPVAADCTALAAALQTFAGYDLSVPPAGTQDGWCVLDGAALRTAVPGQPDLTAERLRLRGNVDGATLVAIQVDLLGLRVAFKPGDEAVDDRVRGLFRLQTADLRLSAAVDSATGQVTINDGRLALSGGTEVTFSATGKATGLSGPALLSGRLMALDLGWRNDGRLLRPVMEMLGEGVTDGAKGGAAVDASRLALRQLVDNLPAKALIDDTGDELEQWVLALPQGRGRLLLSLVAADGIGAGQVLMAGLKDDPLGPAALLQLLSGAQITASWTPGLAP